jgi:hypothetical protein
MSPRDAHLGDDDVASRAAADEQLARLGAPVQGQQGHRVLREVAEQTTEATDDGVHRLRDAVLEAVGGGAEIEISDQAPGFDEPAVEHLVEAE